MLSGFATRNGTKVVIVNENDTATAIAGSVLARANLAPSCCHRPVACRRASRPRSRVSTPAGAYVVGEHGKLSAQVVDRPAAAGGITAASISAHLGRGDAGHRRRASRRRSTALGCGEGCGHCRRSTQW